MNDTSPVAAVRDSLAAVRDSLTDVHMITPLDTIVRQGRATRRRHRQLTSLAATTAVAAAAALVAGLTGLTGPAPAHATGTIRTAAFTIVSHANGTVMLTIKPGVLLHASTLQTDLAHAGIPAKVTVGSFCSSDPAPAGFSQVVVPLQPARQASGWLHRREGVTAALTINPAAMPSGTELSFGNFQLANTQQTSVALIDTGSYTCTSTAPTNAPPGGGMTIRDGALAS
jgi:hypothetical protein